MHASCLLLIALTVFQAIIPVFTRKVVDKKKICNSKNPLRLPQPWKIENRVVRNRIHLRNGLRKINLRNRKSKLQTLHMKISWRNWLRGYFKYIKLERSKGLTAQIFLNRHMWSPPKIRSSLRNIYFVNHKKTTFNCWLLDSAANFRRL